MDFIWGTDSPIDISDPKYPILVGARANGQTGIRISDSRRFLLKVSGMISDYTTDTLKKTIKGLMMSSIKECIAKTIIEKGISILEITPRLTEISDEIQRKLNPRMEDLGITLEHFNVNAITANEGDLDALRKAKAEQLTGMNAADIEAYKVERLSRARAQARATEGYTYQEERRFDILEGAAKNESAAGGLINMGVGLGVGVGVSREVSNMTSVMTESAAPSPSGNARCSDCGFELPAGAKFCPGCGKARPVARFCTQCGSKAPEGSKFCPECGNKLM